MAYTPDQIKEKAYALQKAGAPSSAIEDFVKKATAEAGIKPKAAPDASILDTATREREDFSSKLPGPIGALSNTLGGLATGAIKGVMDMPRLAAEGGTKLTNDAAQTPFGKAVGKKLAPLASKVGLTPDVAKKISAGINQGVEQTAVTTPQSTSEKIGYGGAQMAQLFTPTGLEEGAALLTPKLVKMLPEAAGALKEGKSVMDILHPAMKQAMKIAPKAAATALDFAGKTALQGGDAQEVKRALFLGALTEPGAKLLEGAVKWAGPAFSNTLQKNMMRLSPSMRSQLGKKIEGAADWLTEKNLIGGKESRFDKVDFEVEKMENKVQDFMGGQAKGRTVSRADLENDALDVMNFLKDHRDAIDIRKQIGGYLERLKEFPDQIPVDRAWKLKRSTMKNAFNNNGTKVSDAVEYLFGDSLRNRTLEAVKDLRIEGKTFEEFNKEYGTALDAKKFLRYALGRNENGLIASMIEMGVGWHLGKAAGLGLGGEAIGAAAGRGIGDLIAGTRMKSTLAAGASNLAKLPVGSIAGVASKGLGVPTAASNPR